MNITVRPPKFEDLDKMIEINEKSLPENYNIYFWEKKFFEGVDHSFVATIDTDLIVGYILCDEEMIISFAVFEEYRKKGIGRQLLEHALKTYEDSVKLTVRKSNETALKLYKSLGFIDRKIIPGYYYEEGEDGVEMEWSKTKNTTNKKEENCSIL